MVKSGKISEYRERLDETFSSPQLTNHDSLKILITNQLLRSSPNESEVSHFLDMLRSASISDNEMSKTAEASHGQWKLKDANEEYRVMYREGPQGTPFHTLLVEGYVDGPVDACLCISWESTLYKKWWPQFSFPPFKITDCRCLQKVRISEQLSLVRFVNYQTLAETIVNFFLFEHLQDGLVVALLNTIFIDNLELHISDMKSIDSSTHGLTKEGIPEPKDVVWIDLVGGFAIQRVSSRRSYFRTIANIDMKLDFVPPFLINFISRQLIGSGFRIYKQAVASLSNKNVDYIKALDDPLYSQIREALYSCREQNGATESKEVLRDASSVLQLQHSFKVSGETIDNMEQNVHRYDKTSESLLENQKDWDEPLYGGIVKETSEERRNLNDEVRDIKHEICNSKYNNKIATERKAFNEIEEASENNSPLEKEGRDIDQPEMKKIEQQGLENYNRSTIISPEVEQALKTLEKAITLIREYGSKSIEEPLPVLSNKDNLDQENDSTPLEAIVVDLDDSSAEASITEKIVEEISYEPRISSSNRDIRHAGSTSFIWEVNHNRIAPASPEQCSSFAGQSDQVLLSPSRTENAETPVADEATQGDRKILLDANGVYENNLMEGKKSRWGRKLRFCCFSPGSERD
ncbi:hypothetical protein K2173_004009 [Erythroxylum novogranatense]|uniref:Uncharacterized protein n=1 Tax=Erythroxylum novogranatense TaxID=1862640 RepID=A0AAV8SK89_9ROSI|nr:hypothetical protein K2173_004009 [Erythroxylum novogranatense]